MAEPARLQPMTRLLGRRVISCSFAVVSRKLIEESPTSTATIGASVGKSLECTGRLLARGSCRHQFGRSADLTAGKTPQERQGRRKEVLASAHRHKAGNRLACRRGSLTPFTRPLRRRGSETRDAI